MFQPFCFTHEPQRCIQKHTHTHTHAEACSLGSFRGVIYDFRQNDIKNGGQGAPLAPIYHKLLAKIFEGEGKINLPVAFLNIGGIANITQINEKYEMISMDIGPGNCLIDKWIRINSDQNFDMNGDIARSGKIDKFILEQTIDNFYYNQFNKKKSIAL